MPTDKSFRLPFKSKTLRVVASLFGCLMMLVASAISIPFLLTWGLVKTLAYITLVICNMCLDCVQQNLEN